MKERLLKFIRLIVSSVDPEDIDVVIDSIKQVRDSIQEAKTSPAEK